MKRGVAFIDRDEGPPVRRPHLPLRRRLEGEGLDLKLALQARCAKVLDNTGTARRTR